MPLNFEVPASVREAAQRGLQIHRKAPLPDPVYGVSIGEALASGNVTLDTMSRVYRFFQINSKPYLDELQAMRTETESDLMQSWLLHGAEAGKAWAEAEYARSVKEGLVPEEPLTSLFDMTPDEVYDRFSLSAWRFEYGLDPRKAARFTEEYTRATGLPLELTKAFGDSAPAVNNALLRRLHGVNPFHAAFKALTVEDIEYRLAARLDLVELQQQITPGALSEALEKPVFTTMNAKTAAKMVWPSFVAYAILSVEAPDLIQQYLKADAGIPSMKPPKVTEKPKNYMQYNDTFNIAITYFHPEGARYVDPSGDKKFDGIDVEVIDFLHRTYWKKPVQTNKVRHMLGRARRWTAQNKLAGSLFHIYNADWMKGNWQHILDAIPLDADIRPYFEKFVKGNPMPQEGVKLQQTLTKKQAAPVIAHIASYEAYQPEDLKPIKVRDTKAGKAAKALGTPMGVYSLLQGADGSEYHHLGAYKATDGFVAHGMYKQSTKEMVYFTDFGLAPLIEQKKFIVTQAHKDMAGSVYGAAKSDAPAAEAPAAPPPPPDQPPFPPKGLKGMAGLQTAIDYMLAKSGAEQITPDYKGLVTASLFHAALKEKYGEDFKLTTDPQVKLKVIAGNLAENGIYSYIGPVKYGASNMLMHLIQWDDNGEILVKGDSLSADQVHMGNVIVYSIDGEPYAGATAKAATTGSVDAQLLKAKEHFEEQNLAVEIADMYQSQMHSKITLAYGTPLASGMEFKFEELGFGVWTYVGMLHIQGLGPQHIFINSEDGKFRWRSDSWVVKQLQSGNMKLVTQDSKEASELQKFLADEFSDDYDIEDIVGRMWVHTASYDAAKNRFGAEIKTGAILEDSKGKLFTFVNPFAAPDMVFIVFRDEDGDLVWFDDPSLADIIATGNVKISGYNVTPSDDPDEYAPEPMEQPDDAKTEPDTPAYTPAFKSGWIIKNMDNGFVYYVVAAPSDTDEDYLLYQLVVQNGYVSVENYDVEYVEGASWVTLHNTTTPDALATETPIQKPYEKQPPPPGITFVTGDTFVMHGDNFTYLFTVYNHMHDEDTDPLGEKWTESGKYIVAYVTEPASTGSYPRLRLLNVEAFLQDVDTTSSYDPPAMTPEKASVDALALSGDEDQGYAELSGTKHAFAWLANKGWKPITKGSDPTFDLMWDLGAKLQYGNDIRTIIGYGFDPQKKKSLYVTMTGKGNVSYKYAEAGNQKYGPVIEMLQDVIDQLLPLPGKEAVKFPKLNYHLSTEAKEVAVKKGLTYVPAPGNAPYFVGTKLADVGNASEWKLAAWTDGTGKNKGTLMAVLLPKNKGMITHQLVKFDDLAESFTLDYANTTTVGETGEVTFGKQPGTYNNVTVGLPGGLMLPTEPPGGWDEPESVKQPPFASLPTAGHVSAGIVAVIPPGAKVNYGPVQNENVDPLVMLVYPMQEFGGYKLTVPKGTVEKGEALEIAAVRETWEETGCSVEPVAFLGDYDSGSSKTRMFIGHITGGNPKKAGMETDAVTFKTLGMDPSKESYWGTLHKRDQNILKDVRKWVEEHGYPNETGVDKGEHNSAVTGPQDVEGETGPKMYDPNASHDYGNLSPEALDYKVSSKVRNWTGSVGYFTTALVTDWHFVKAVGPLNQGYPPPGALFKPKEELWVHDGEFSANLDVNTVYRVLAFIYRDQPNMGDPRIDVIVEEADNPGTYFSLRIYALKPSGGFDILADPDLFVPMQAVAQPKSKTLPAVDLNDDLWKSLVFKAKFPIHGNMLYALKSHVNSVLGVNPTGFDTWRTPPAPLANTFPQYGAPFSVEGVDYQCLGYVYILVQEKTYRVMFAEDKDGLQDVIAVDETTAPKITLQEKTGTQVWFTHPDPAVNKIMETLATNGGKLKAVGVPMKKFSNKWMKEAGVPNYAITTVNLVEDVAALFVPGMASKAQYDAVIGCLKTRMKASQAGKTKKAGKLSAAVDAAPKYVEAPTQAAEPSAPPVVFADMDFESPLVTQTMDNPSGVTFKDTGESVNGGSNPIKKLTTLGGLEWIFKTPKDGNLVRVEAEVAAAKLSKMLKGNVVPVGQIEFEGKVGVIQPMVSGDTLTDGPDDLSDDDKAEVLAQHMVDMFMGDHDGAPCNWLRSSSGKLVPIDRGQAFKFLLQGKTLPLDVTFEPSGNANGLALGKRLLAEWGQGTTKIPDKAWKAAKEVIDRIQTIPDETLKAITLPIFEKAGLTTQKRTSLLKTLQKSRDSYLKDWTKVLKGLNGHFKWPKIGKVKKIPTILQPDALTSSPEELDFGKAEDEKIKKAVASGWVGHTIKLDRDMIEDQAVMVRAVVRQIKPGQRVPATLIHFRVNRHAGLEWSNHMLQNAPTVKHIEASGKADLSSKLLKVDASNKYWEKIRAGIGTINHHLAVLKDNTSPNMDTVNTALALIPELEALSQKVLDQTGTYAPTNEPNMQVKGMVNLYLNYLQYIKEVSSDWQQYVGQHSPMFAPYMPPAPEEEKKNEPEDLVTKLSKLPYEINPVPHGASWPTIVRDGDDMVVMDLVGAQYNPSSQAQFIVKDKNQTLMPEIHVNPPGPGVGNLQEGVEGHKGISWGIINGEPSRNTVAHLIKLLSSAVGKAIKVATPKDNEFLFWIKQGFIQQQGGDFHPKSGMHGEGLVDSEFTKLVNEYRAGNDDPKLLAKLQEFVAAQTGKSVAVLKKRAKDLIVPTSTPYSGWERHHRLDFTREELIKLLGPDASIAHAVKAHKGLEDYEHINIRKLFDNFRERRGTLLSHNMRQFYGAPAFQGSAKSDYGSGGTQGLFSCFRKAGGAGADTFYFDIGLATRLDVYVVDRADGYGNLKSERIFNPKEWKKWMTGHASEYAHDSVSQGSHFQVNLRHDVDIPTYARMIVLPSKSDRDFVRKVCKEIGWTKFGPFGGKTKTIEQVVVTSGEGKW
jgi:hypothetical protein